ncbi:MAG: hypothetical protein ACE5G1_08250 [bacterium]
MRNLRILRSFFKVRNLLVIISAVLLMAGCRGEDKNPVGSNDPEEDLDTIPPAQITDLSSTVSDPPSVFLTWSAPDDNGMEGGPANAYEVYVSFDSITQGNYTSATLLEGAPTPSAPNTLERMIIESGLPQNQSLYFAVRAIDKARNYSPISPNATIDGVNYPHRIALSNSDTSGNVGQRIKLQVDIYDPDLIIFDTNGDPVNANGETYTIKWWEEIAEKTSLDFYNGVRTVIEDSTRAKASLVREITGPRRIKVEVKDSSGIVAEDSLDVMIYDPRPFNFIKGWVIKTFTPGDYRNSLDRTLKRLTETGFDHISIEIYYAVDDLQDTTVEPVYEAVPPLWGSVP